MKFDQDALDELVSSIDLLEYAEKSFEFKRHGIDDYFTRCPLHVDKTPSLSINTGKNLWYCHSCHRGGNIIGWMMTFEKLSFDDAVKKVCEISGKGIDTFSSCDAVLYFKKLKNSIKEKERVVEREILPYDVYESKYEKAYPEEWLEEGISKESMDLYDIRIDASSNRIVYPVLDSEFNLISVKGRTRFDNYKLLNLPKYINYYKIGEVDYFTGMKQAVDSIMKTGEIIIVEGIKSVMKISGWGYKNVVAAETSRINQKQIELLLKLGIKSVVIAFDQDVQVKEIIQLTQNLRHFMKVSIVTDKFGVLESKMSPCDKGKEVWDMLYEKRLRL